MDTAGDSSSKLSRAPWRFQLGCVLLLVCACVCTGSQPSLQTYRPEHVRRNTEDGVFAVASGENATLIFFGSNLTNETRLWLSDQFSCTGVGTTLQNMGNLSVMVDDGTVATISVHLTVTERTVFYFCLSADVDQDESAANELHLQGEREDPALQIVIVLVSETTDLIPLPAEIVITLVLIVMSGLFSGLNLGLMSLDPTTLKLVMESGTKRQKTYAKLIYRVRRYGNYLLCTLLLGNVLVNSTLAILLANLLGSGLYAVVSSTIAIVIFGEIIPQAICSRYGLMIGAYTIWLTYIFMVLTFPLSFPISIILHFILGKEIGAVYTREELLGLLKVTEEHHGIGKDEVQIISGALRFKEKQAQDVMTKFEDVYCLDIHSMLDFRTMRDIYDSGFSRIPVYEEEKSNIVGVLYAKDLAFVDPDDQTPLKQVLSFYNRDLTTVYHDTRLDQLLEEFSRGKCHMAVVSKVDHEGPGDPVLEVIGVVTLEDIVEEILQLEIVDETDRIMDNRSLKPSQRKHVDVGEFAEEGILDRPHLSPQQKLAIYQFLSSSIDAFKSDKLLPVVLKQLLNRDTLVRRLHLEKDREASRTLYRTDSPASSFTLVIEGHLMVEVGKDGMRFEAGPFYHFGEQALLSTQGTEYVPDFTARPVSECLLLVISRSDYMDACQATLFQQTRDGEVTSGGQNGDIQHSTHLENLQTAPPPPPPPSSSSTPQPPNLDSAVSPTSTSGNKKPRRYKKKLSQETECLLAEPLTENEPANIVELEAATSGEEYDDSFATTISHKPTSGGRDTVCRVDVELQERRLRSPDKQGTNITTHSSNSTNADSSAQKVTSKDSFYTTSSQL